MKNAIVYPIVAALFLCLSACAPAKTGTATDPGGPAIDSPEGRFSAVLPAEFGAPQRQTRSVNSAVGKLDFVMYLSELRSGVCIVSYNDYPPSVFEGVSDTKAMFDGGRDGALRNVKGTLTEERECTLGGVPGRSFHFKGSKDGKDIYGRACMFVDRPRLYQVMYMGFEQASVDSPSVQGFFNSFKLKK